ncbi:superoxide dismutase [Vibrio cholerae]|nr:superoxide dismutase [Vibrio cholerae]
MQLLCLSLVLMRCQPLRRALAFFNEETIRVWVVRFGCQQNRKMHLAC